jgi:hypothetical protein
MESDYKNTVVKHIHHMIADNYALLNKFDLRAVRKVATYQQILLKQNIKII